MSRAPKSIAVLGTRGIPANYGGFETAAEFIAIGLREAGFDVTVSCEMDPALPEELPTAYRGVRLARFPVRDDLRPLSEIIYDVRALLSLGRRADIIYMFGYGAGFSFWLAKLLRKKLIVNCDGLEWARPKFDRLSRFLLRVNEALGLMAADVIIADSQNIQDYIRKTYGRSSHFLPYGTKIPDAPQPWDRAALERAKGGLSDEITPDEFYLILSRIEPDNNIAQILRGFSQSKSLRKILVVGRAPSRQYWAQLQSIATRDPRIVLAGPIYDLPLKNALRWNCAGYFHGHMVGGTNPALLEGLASGNVILATDVPFNREVVGGNGYPAYFFHPLPSEVRDVTDKVDDQVLHLRKVARVKGPQRIQEGYCWERIVDGYRDLLKSMV